ncbi:MAG: hypothetical protein L0271_26715 [Gemmatimonadetes bacterium]|nr:hypothetical protein [Gemmatimonadota bacterium]
MSNRSLDAIREGVLDRMEKQERAMKLAIAGAAVLEGLLFLAAFLIMDFNDATHRLIVILSVLSYMILALGLIALGAHVSRSVGRIVAVLDDTGSR